MQFLDSDVTMDHIDAGVTVFDEVFGQSIYEIGPLPEEPVIIDCGANNGIASLFFAHRYRAARIIAFEPDPTAFALLERNTAHIAEMERHQAALGSHDGYLSFYISDNRKAPLMMSAIQSRVPDPVETEVPCRRLSTLLPDRVDLLKIDVEGMEWQIMDDLETTDSFGKVDRFAVEFHHHLPPERNDLARFLGYFDRNSFAYQLEATRGVRGGDAYQDVMIYGYRSY